MKRKFFVLLIAVSGMFVSSVHSEELTIKTSETSFLYPLYERWSDKYENDTGIKVNYQPVPLINKTSIMQNTDFEISDIPLSSKDLEKRNQLQFPMVMYGIVPVVTIASIEPGQLKLSPDVLADIFLKKITVWSDERIKEINPGLELPRLEITVVHRSEPSETTWFFTHYLSRVSSEWNDTVGNGKAVSWPAGISIKGGEDLAQYVKNVDGSIGYVEFVYVMKKNLVYTLLQNRSGNFITPTIKNFESTVVSADWKNQAGYHVTLIDQSGDNSWPIIGTSFILMDEKQTDANLFNDMCKFLKWCYIDGSDIAVKLGYLPVPMKSVDIIESIWSEEIEVRK